MVMRIACVTIALFWLGSIYLLLKLEVFDSDSALQTVPATDVLALPVIHQQDSSLKILYQGERVGSLSIRPTANPDSNRVDFHLHGNMSLSGLSNHRISWNTLFSASEELEVDNLDFRILLNNPNLSFELRVVPGEDRVSYRLSYDDVVLREEQRSMSMELTKEELETLGIPSLPLQEIGQAWELEELRAFRTTYPVGNERINAYKVVSNLGGGWKLELYIDQVGQILELDTFLGYRLLSEDLEF